jgi:hypothetical protein
VCNYFTKYIHKDVFSACYLPAEELALLTRLQTSQARSHPEVQVRQVEVEVQVQLQVQVQVQVLVQVNLQL